MTEKKKKQPEGFAKDKNAFAGGSSAKKDAARNTKQRQSGARQPRDADKTSGHDVQKSGQPGRAETSGHNVQKPRGKPEGGSFRESRNSFQGGTEKTAAQKTKNTEKKRRQSRQFQKENSFAKEKEKPEGDNAEGREQGSFTKEENTFTEEGGGEQTEETKDVKDDYRRRDTYHQSEKKGRYRRRERQDRERTKKSDFERDFQTKDATFAKDDAFADGAEPEFQGSKKLNKLQGKAEKAAERTQKARKKLPKKKEYSLERVFDEKTGRVKYVLTAEVKEKPFQAENPVKRMAGRTGSEFANYAHGKVAEAEKDNSAVEGAHKTEQKAEDGYRFIKRHYKGKEQRRRAKVAKLEKSSLKRKSISATRNFLRKTRKCRKRP